MGMAASQARLLTITARIHDVEYQAQSIQNAKLALATKNDEVYREYLQALDATTLTVKDYEGNIIPATFNNLCGPNAVESSQKYALFDERGRLLVTDAIAERYEEFKALGWDDDAYAFAYFALGYDEDPEAICGDTDSEYEIDMKEYVYNLLNQLMHPDNDNEYDIISDLEDSSEINTKPFVDLVNNISDILNSSDFDPNESDYNDPKYQKYTTLLTQLETKFFKNHAELMTDAAPDIFGLEGEFDQAMFDYYVRMFNEIEQAGGCRAISEISNYDGIEGIGDAANNGEWLQSMIKAGKISVAVINSNKKTGDVEFGATGVPSDSILEYTTTTTIDKRAYAKAEAEYQHKTKEIDRKDKAFDMDLSKLETERNALTTEYESVQKVIEDNIDRTFGIFS